MGAIEAFFLGMMVAWTPSLIILVRLLREAPLSDSQEFLDCQEQKAAQQGGPGHGEVSRVLGDFQARS